MFNTNEQTPDLGVRCQVDWTSSGSLSIPGLAYGTFGGSSLVSPQCTVLASTSTIASVSQGYDVNVDVSFTTQFPSGVAIPVWARVINVTTGAGPYSTVGVHNLASAGGSIRMDSSIGSGSGLPYCSGSGHYVNATLKRYQNGTVGGGAYSATTNLGGYSGWVNEIRGGRLFESATGIERGSNNGPATESDFQIAFLPLEGVPNAQETSFRIVADYFFYNHNCQIVELDGPFWYSDGYTIVVPGFSTNFTLAVPAGDPTPHIESITPEQIPSSDSTEVRITGSGFGTYFPGQSLLSVSPSSGNNSPTGSLTATPILEWSSSQIRALFNATSSASGSYDVRVTSAGVTGSFQSGGGATSPVSPPKTVSVCSAGTVAITSRPMIVSGSTNGQLPYFSTLNASSSSPGIYTWSTDSPDMIRFDFPNVGATNVRILRRGKARITVTLSTTCGRISDSLTFVLSEDVTVVGWINGNAISLPSGASPGLVGRLNTPDQCFATIGTWVAAGQGLGPPFPAVTTDIDRRYANAFLNKWSANNPPPNPLLDPESVRVNPLLYRAFNRFEAAYEVVSNFGNTIQAMQPLTFQTALGRTPDPCAYESVTLAAERSSRDALHGVRASYVFQLNEGRIGESGQQVNAYLNKGIQGPTWAGATPWIWSSIKLDTDGRAVSLTTSAPNATAQIYPTYYVYAGQSLVQTIQQGDIEPFVQLDINSSYQIPPLP